MKLSFKRAALFAAVVVLYFFIIDHTPRGTECQKSTSPDGFYIAERCLLHWHPGSDSDYVGRVYDAKSGKLLAQRTFSTTVPEILWFDDGGMSFSRGGDEAAFITFPLSVWDRLLAARPRL
jgi:hypothetical protein